LIQIQHLSKTFAQPVLRNVTLSIPAGCLYGLVGPGASGKSVLLKMITGLMRPDAGTLHVDGQDVLGKSEIELARFRLKFGMLFQNNALFDSMTVADNVAFPLRRLGELGEPEIAERVRERLAAVSLA
jgi:phospholipid/cholesterol/gamma-HCH transport system ATP-binding protein